MKCIRDKGCQTGRKNIYFEKIGNLIDVFANESKRYLDDVIDVNIFQKMFNAIAHYFLSRTGAPYEIVKSLLVENFVYLALKRSIENTAEIDSIAGEKIFAVPLCLADRINESY